MLPDILSLAYSWRLSLVFVGVPVLTGLLWLVFVWVKPSFRYDDRPPVRPKLKLALTISVTVILLSASAAMVWNPPLTRMPVLPQTIAPLVLLFCTFYFSGRIRSLSVMINQPNRADGTIVGIGWVIVLATGVLLWASAIYLALRVQIPAFPPEAFPAGDQIRRLGAMTVAALWSSMLCGFGLYLRRIWRGILAERERWARLSDRS